jgi:hypothetical protein
MCCTYSLENENAFRMSLRTVTTSDLGQTEKVEMLDEHLSCGIDHCHSSEALSRSEQQPHEQEARFMYGHM